MLRVRRAVRIEWGHCDPAGIVFNPRYFEFFDACTAGLFEAVGLPKPLLLKTYGLAGFPLVDVRASFRIASRCGDEILIESCIPSWGRTSFRVKHQVFKGSEVAVEALETRVMVARRRDEPEAFKAHPVPHDLPPRFA